MRVGVDLTDLTEGYRNSVDPTHLTDGLGLVLTHTYDRGVRVGVKFTDLTDGHRDTVDPHISD